VHLTKPAHGRRKNSHIAFSKEKGRTWSEPRKLPAVLTGDRHQAVYGPDGRLFVSFRDKTPEGYTSPTESDGPDPTDECPSSGRGAEREHLIRPAGSRAADSREFLRGKRPLVLFFPQPII
jgi:hypothetical protein